MVLADLVAGYRNSMDVEEVSMMMPEAPATRSSETVADSARVAALTDEQFARLCPDGYHLSRAGSWDPYDANPDDIDDH